MRPGAGRIPHPIPPSIRAGRILDVAQSDVSTGGPVARWTAGQREEGSDVTGRVRRVTVVVVATLVAVALSMIDPGESSAQAPDALPRAFAHATSG